MTSTSLSWATPNEHSVRKVALAFALKLLPGDCLCEYVRENTLRGELPLAGPVRGALRDVSGCNLSGRPALLVLEGDSSKSGNTLL